MNENTFTVKLAEVYVQIRARDEHMKHFCRKYIEDGEPDFTVEVSEKDIEEERERAVEYFGYGDTSDAELEKLWIYRTIAEKMPSFGVFLMHASAVAVDGQAYLFAGPSGAGKTTQTKLWKQEFQDRMKVINDDKPLIRITDEDILVCGSPWCGKERWNNNIIAPLRGIIDVEQAEENRIEPMGKVAAWEPRAQRPELWDLYNTRLGPGESMRVFPLSNWTERDIWAYIAREGIEVVPLYFAKERPVVERDGNLIMVDDDRMRILPGEKIEMKKVRFRTLGCYPLTGGIESDAADPWAVYEETCGALCSERTSRVIDGDAGVFSMEKRKKEGYF